MTRTHGETIRELSDGWAVAWDATDVSPEVRRLLDEALEEQKRQNAQLLGGGERRARRPKRRRQRAAAG
jgi:hypothetical protein